jgi:hypothetical protein
MKSSTGKIDLQELLSKDPKVKYSCAKRAIAVSRENPKALYPDFGFSLKLLEGDNKILKWSAIQIIGNLSKVDSQKKVDALIPHLIALLSDKTMVTAANAIGALSKIAKNKAEHQEMILGALLRVEKAKYYSKGELSPECTNVAIGHVIQCLEQFGKPVCQRNDVKNFLKRQTKNTRPKVKLMAEQLLDKSSQEKAVRKNKG